MREGTEPAIDPARLEESVRTLEGERHPRTSPAALAEAERWLAERFRGLGLEVDLHTFGHRGGRHHNVVGRLPGRDRSAPRVLVGAHFDTVPGTPGADDNASGVAVLVETARALAGCEPAADVEFVGFNLEEPQGWGFGVGSAAYAATARREGTGYRGCLVLEMVGYTDPRPDAQRVPGLLFWKDVPESGTFLAAVANWTSGELLKRFRRSAARRVPGLTVVGLRSPARGWLLPVTRLSDHSRFWDQGYPALMLTDTAFLRNPNYHAPSDRAETLDYGFMALVAEATAASVEELAGC